MAPTRPHQATERPNELDAFAEFRRGRTLAPSCRFQIMLGTLPRDLRQLAVDRR